MKWILLLLWDPIEALDLKDRRNGAVDHGKVVGLFGFLSFYLLIFLGKLPSVWHTIALLSAVFGWAGWRAFLSSRHTPSTEPAQEEEAFLP